MPIDHFSVLVSPTYRCNADCEYCFEHKTSDVMEVADFEEILRRIVAYLKQLEVSSLTLYWQGGEIFTMSPDWFLRAHEACQEISEKEAVCITNRLQSNLIGYGPRWRRVVSEMFGDNIGSSLDFPNLYRKTVGGAPENFNNAWLERYQETREAGIQVGVIAVLNQGTLSIGAEKFYSYYVEELHIHSWQLNTPYPGGPPTPAKRNFPLNNNLLSAFYADLFDLWMRRGRLEDVCISPFDPLIRYFRTGENQLSCCWSENCANIFVGIGPKGDVGQCECFVSSYPEQIFGNIRTCQDMADIMNSPIRKPFLERPLRLMENEDCAECAYLAVCHGGCPVRAYSATGTLFAKDPDCLSNKTLFDLARKAAIELDRLESAVSVDKPPNPCE